MKKEYKAPEINCIDLEMESLLAATSQVNVNFSDDEDDYDGAFYSGSNNIFEFDDDDAEAK